MGNNNVSESSLPSTAQQSKSDYALRKNPEDVFSNQLVHILDHLNPIRFELEYYQGGLEEKHIGQVYYQIDNTNDDEKKQNLKATLAKEYDVVLRHKISIMVKHLLQLSETLDSPMGVHEGVAYYYQSSYWIKLEDEDLNLFLVEYCVTASMRIITP